MNQDPWMDQDSKPERLRAGPEVGKTRPRRRTAKPIVLIVCAVIVALAVWKAADTHPNFHFSLGDSGSPDNYSDWFKNYYSQNNYDDDFTGEYDIPAAETGTGVTLTLSPTPEGAAMTLQEIYKKCAPSVTAITAGVDDETYYWGTGIVMTEDGYILTNAHVIDGTVSATVTLWDDSEYEASLVGADSLSDIAVLKIDASGLTPAEFGDSDGLEVGDRVVAIGNPLGEELRGTMTDGIISAINRDIYYNGHTLTLLQTNAAINEGNSGGPLVNEYGQVIGITNMKIISSYSSIEGIGFAIPTSSLKAVTDSLIATGRVSGRPGLGLTIGAIPSEAKLQYDLPEGLYVSHVSEGSSCEKAGIQTGDILTAVNGIPVTTIDEVNSIKDGLGVGDTLTLTIWRDGKTFDVTISLMEMTDLYG